MIIPTSVKQQVVDIETGEATSSAQQYQDNLNQQMQKCLGEDGFVMPARTTEAIQNIVNPANQNARPNGTIWYDTTLKKYVGYEDGVLVSFATTPI
jgi:hypothetical protein